MVPGVCSVPLSFLLLVGRVQFIVDRQPFRQTSPRQFTIHVANDLTSRQQYWLAYLDDHVARDLHRAAEGTPSPQQSVALQERAFQYAQQAAILTRQFATADATDWIEIQQLLAGAAEFITPLVAEMEGTVRTLESRGERDRASRVRDAIWSELAFLLRIDPARQPDLERRFAAERPNDSFDLFIAERLVSGRPILPEATLGALSAGDPDLEMHAFRGAWRLLEIWDGACGGCQEALATADTLAREFPDRVFAIGLRDAPEQARLHLAASGLTLPAAVASDETARQLGIRALPAHILVSPDGRFASLTGAAWADEARRILTATSR